MVSNMSGNEAEVGREEFSAETRADQKNGRRTLKFSGRTDMHGKSRVSSAIKYDCFKLDRLWELYIRKTWLHCI